MEAPGDATTTSAIPVEPLTSGAYAGLEAAFLEVMRRRNPGHVVALAAEAPASRAASRRPRRAPRTAVLSASA